ncbi:uncharacterized protein Z520_06586 [Fonsecaea multimorphosa CBS 102226]|uniref:DNA (cytosine-5-)-methyltransferase n=1 Tax=Fonsecaea multimorphosa CBS 102226 TaxID=1442371 RepID=A0A0D2KM91_9EURO|nr:uncharacterized protein Z520_06586 [Fonsecaea multimorphosa CBS 102226]KIX97808.1 hypothetical protein Z520_06586 [Fonsecaea multimorphosa CBS 102226]
MNADPFLDQLLQAVGKDPDTHDAVLVADDSSEDGQPELDCVLSDDEEELRAGRVHTGLTTGYVSSWRGREAFRELYQNWKDAIIASFHLDPRSFRPVFKETRTEIHITIHRSAGQGGQASGELLGFIRFNRKAGSVELTNFQAQLQRNSLGLGKSSKQGQDEFAGCHGEGFKVAAVVLRREGHSVRFASAGYYWNFGLSGRYRTNLYCRLTLSKPEKVEKSRRKYALQRAKPNFKRGLTSNIWEDVSVKIGKARGSSVFTVSEAVSEAEFRSWLTVSIDLNPPSPDDVVQTPAGDLILDSRFAAHIYLKGLQIDGHAAGYVYGYNFARGSIGRDRTHLQKQSEETQILVDIWEHAILSQRTDLTDAYIKLLRHQEDCPEVASTSDRLSESSARIIWERLRIIEPDAFFYCEVDPSHSVTADQIALIPAEFQRRPVAVSRALWNLLRKFSFVRTPPEERYCLFKGSEVIAPHRTPFSAHVLRALLASLSLHPKLNNVRLIFVDGGGTDLDLAYDKEANQVHIHGKWLDFQKVHENGLCEVLRLIDGENIGGGAFFCDHVVGDLFEALLSVAGSALEISTPDLRHLRRTMRELLTLMPRLVRVAPTGAMNELEVRWVGNEGGLVSEICHSNICYHVTLHQESSCRSRRGQMVHVHRRDDPLSNGHTSRYGLPFRAEVTVDCGCPFQIVPRTLSRAIFTGLDPHERYFPMVARGENQSFFAMPPTSVAPRGILLPASVADSPQMATRRVKGDREVQEYQPRYADSPEIEGNNEATSDSNDQVPESHPGISGQQSRRPLRWEGAELCWEDLNGQIAFGKDEDEWRRWHTEDLPKAFSKLLVHREKHHTPTFHPVASLECAHLDFHFVKDEYALIRLGGDSSLEHVIFIHEISYCEEEHDTATTYLLVTKYSKLWSFHSDLQPLEVDNDDASANQLEMLLHFEEFDRMGMRDDAEVIRLDDIVYAADLTACSKAPLSGHGSSSASGDDIMFCRFAVRGATINEQVACWTPIASHLLQRRDRWVAPQFINASRPSVVDFTPGILGPAEGFSQAGFDIQAALGFDQERHLSWKIRHTQSQVYDGPPRKVLDDIYAEQLRPPSTPNPAPPNIALVAGGNAPFRVSDANQRMPSAEHFASQLDLVNIAIEAPSKPDFLVMLSSPAMLHASVVPRLLATITKLLKHRRSVHMKLCHLREHGLPQARSILLVVASPFCAPLPWCLHWAPFPSVLQSITLRDLIVDLDFDNCRTGAGPERAFVCSPPLEGTHEDRSSDAGPSHVYNHQTGQQVPPSWKVPLQWDTDGLVALSCSPLAWTHPGRQDLLTVRELARLQGFTDDFVFYQSTSMQYQDVWSALPPIISKLVGKTILHVIQGSLKAKVGGRLDGQRAAKRSRQESHG